MESGQVPAASPTDQVDETENCVTDNDSDNNVDAVIDAKEEWSP